MDVSKMTVGELKAVAYDLMNDIDRVRMNLQKVNTLIMEKQKDESPPVLKEKVTPPPKEK